MDTDEIVVLKLAVEKFGQESQIDMAIEECSELIESMEQNMQGKIDTAINDSIDDANSTIEVNVPNIV